MTEICTPPQQADRQQFAHAVTNAINYLEHPAVLEVYAALVCGRQRVFMAALKDILRAPKLFNLQTDAYTGRAGQPIRVQVMDSSFIISLGFSLYSGDGSLLESGKAKPEEDGFSWVYQTQAFNPQQEGSTVVIRAMSTSPVFFHL